MQTSEPGTSAAPHTSSRSTVTHTYVGACAGVPPTCGRGAGKLSAKAVRLVCLGRWPAAVLSSLLFASLSLIFFFFGNVHSVFVIRKKAIKTIFILNENNGEKGMIHSFSFAFVWFCFLIIKVIGAHCG